MLRTPSVPREVDVNYAGLKHGLQMDTVWDWNDLTAELDQWAAGGQVASLWWRDDDAVKLTPPLRYALNLSQRYQVPIHLSVIPARMSSAFGDELDRDVRMSVLQHGYAHAEGELYGNRAPERVLAELVDGREILSSAFSNQFIPVLVPPWNLIRNEFIPLIAQAGLQGLSADGQRSARFAVPGVEILNTHSGPLEWQNGIPRFAGTSVPLQSLVEHLRARRSGTADLDEPTGFCTHHLRNDQASWGFFERLLAETSAHRAARWIGLREILNEPR